MEKDKEIKRILISSFMILMGYYLLLSFIGEIYDIPDLKPYYYNIFGRRRINKALSSLVTLLSLLTVLVIEKIKKHKREKV